MSLMLLLFCVTRNAYPALLAAGEYPTAGKYIGVLPCADCAGIWTEIVLTDPGPNLGQGNGTFVTTERFTGGIHGGAIVTTRGSWSTVSWNTIGRNDSVATLKLIGKGSGETVSPARYFLCNHGLSLELRATADRGTDTIEPGTLRRVIPLPSFGPVTETDSKNTLYGTVGDSFEITLPASSMDTALHAWKMTSPVSQIVALMGVTGSKNQNAFATDVMLKAVAPGQIRLEFRSMQDPAKVVTFSFDITNAQDNACPD